MTQPLPNWCAFGSRAHRAQYAVDAPNREVITCAGHLPHARQWAGAGHTVTPLGDSPPPPEQQTLF
jgi:hypothetical protein